MEIKQIIINKISVNLIPGRVVCHDIVIEVPEDVGWRFWSVGDDTSEVDGGSSVDMKVWRSMNPHVWN